MGREKKMPAGINRPAEAVCETTRGDAILKEPARKKNPAAVALGRLGGLKGGKARAKKLSEEERKRIAQKAAKARWSKK
jgi:hypothetical protein